MSLTLEHFADITYTRDILSVVKDYVVTNFNNIGLHEVSFKMFLDHTTQPCEFRGHMGFRVEDTSDLVIQKLQEMISCFSPSYPATEIDYISTSRIHDVPLTSISGSNYIPNVTPDRLIAFNICIRASDFTQLSTMMTHSILNKVNYSLYESLFRRYSNSRDLSQWKWQTNGYAEYSLKPGVPRITRDDFDSDKEWWAYVRKRSGPFHPLSKVLCKDFWKDKT